MILNWPQCTIIVLLAIGFGIAVSKHGEPNTGNHSMWWTMFGIGVELFLLTKGGFFG